MVDSRLSEIAEHTVLHDDDLMPIQDSQTSPVTPKRVKVSTLKTAFGSDGSSGGGGSLPDYTPLLLNANESPKNYDEGDNNSLILVTYTGASTDVWLKSADDAAMDGVIFTIKKVGTANVSIGDTGGNMIDGSPSCAITTQYASVTIRARYDSGSGQGVWDVIASHTP